MRYIIKEQWRLTESGDIKTYVIQDTESAEDDMGFVLMSRKSAEDRAARLNKE